MVVETESPIAASAAESHKTMSSAPPVSLLLRRVLVLIKV